MTTILIADDDETIVALVRLELKRAGFRVLSASNGEDAWELIANALPDMAILDVSMPKMDGFQLLHKMKQDRSTKNIPVIMLTAKKGKKDIASGVASGIIDYIVKPFEVKDLMSRIKISAEKMRRGVTELPRQIIPLGSGNDNEVSHEKTEKPKSGGDKEVIRILFVENYEANKQLVKPSLEKQGYIVDIVEKEDEALSMLENNHYHIALINSEMPYLDGYVLCNQIRQRDKKHKMSRIVIGIGTEEKSNENKKWLASGMNYYVSKPISVKKIVEIIKKHEKEALERKVI